MVMNKILTLGLGTLLFFGLGGFYLIEQVQERSFVTVLLEGMTVPLQLGFGIAYGLVTALLALWIISRDFFKKEKKFYHSIIFQLNLNFASIIFLSLCAGIGEEIFFRAGLQPLLGLWPTSVIFVLLHGYLNPYNWRISIYGIAMVFFMAGVGYLFREVGLISAMAAHAVLDIILFMKLVDKTQ